MVALRTRRTKRGKEASELARRRNAKRAKRITNRRFLLLRSVSIGDDEEEVEEEEKVSGKKQEGKVWSDTGEKGRGGRSRPGIRALWC